MPDNEKESQETIVRTPRQSPTTSLGPARAFAIHASKIITKGLQNSVNPLLLCAFVVFYNHRGGEGKNPKTQKPNKKTIKTEKGVTP